MLVIAVVNARDDSDDGVIERNRQLLSRLDDTLPQQKLLDERTGLHATPFGELLCIDRSTSDRFPRKRGAGHRRP